MEQLILTPPIHWEPAPYQKRAVEFLLERTSAGLFLEPGLRKSSCTLKAYKVLRDAKQVRSALVVAPLRVCFQVWPMEIAKWKEFQDITYTILHGDLKKREARLQEKVNLYIINPDGLSWLLKKSPNILRELGIDMLILDESSQFKHTNTQRFKLLKPFLPKFKRRIILTGTPNPNGYLDLFGQIYILDLGHALGQYITHFRNQYFYALDRFGWEWKLMKGSDKKIQDRIRPLVLRLEDKDYLDLPEAIGLAGDATENRIFIELPAAARKVYRDLEKQMIAKVMDKEVTVASAAVAVGKCAQVANGGLYYEDDSNGAPKRNAAQLHSEKTDALLELVDELQGQHLMVAYEYDHDLQRIAAALFPNTPLNQVPYIGGNTSPKRSAELSDAWNAGNLPILLGHPQAISRGLNLQYGGNHLAWYSIPWNLEHYIQLYRRLLRSGSPFKHIFIYHIIAHDTVDLAKLAALRSKTRTQQSLLDALKNYIAEKGGGK